MQAMQGPKHSSNMTHVTNSPFAVCWHTTTVQRMATL